METIQHIILDTTLTRIADKRLSGYICHACCLGGHCTFERSGRLFRMEAGDCMIVPRRGDLYRNIRESDDFRVYVIYVTQEFIELSTPQSNYGMRGHLALFENPIMRLSPEQLAVCRQNFEAVKRRLEQTDHCFRHDALRNAVECMIIDFFDIHARQYGSDRISSQQHQLMEQFIEMLERGDFRQNRETGYYADRLCVSSKYLSEVSKKVSGLPATYWITRYASLDISRLLRNRSLSFTDISELFGFSSLSHFSRYVVKNLGAKPSELRE